MQILHGPPNPDTSPATDILDCTEELDVHTQQQVIYLVRGAAVRDGEAQCVCPPHPGAPHALPAPFPQQPQAISDCIRPSGALEQDTSTQHTIVLGSELQAAQRTRGWTQPPTCRSRPLRPRPAQVTFVDSDSGASTTVACPESEFLLDSAEASGVALPSSCRGGLCGSCVARLHEGRVDMDSWADGMEIPITVEQLQAGFILVSRGRDPRWGEGRQCSQW